MGVWEEMENEAEARGKTLGEEEGEARGKAIGEAIAIVTTSEKIACRLITTGRVAFVDIASACGLSLKRVQELAKSVL